MIFSGLIITFILAFFKHFFLWLFIIGIYLGIKKYYNKKLSSDDFNKNVDYYREILKDYSVDLLLYIDNFKINYPNVLIAMLLQLKLKGIIDIYDNKIQVNNTINLSDLSSTEKYILNNIINNKLVINNYNEYNQLIFEEGLKRNLLVKKETSNNLFSVPNVIYLFVLLCYLLFITNNYSIYTTNDGFSFISSTNFELSFIFSMIVMVFSFITPIFLISFPIITRIKTAIYNNAIQNEPYFRTKEAENINKKLEGLKRFLKDFSALDERESKELMLWDEYLIYSVLFGHNDKIIVEYKDLIAID